MIERRTFLAALTSVLAVGPGRPAAGGGQVSSLPAPPLDDLVAANRILAMEGVLDGMGHISVRHTGPPNRFLLARSMAPELVTADDIMEYDFESNAVDARGRASYRERFIHSEIYKVRPDVNSIVHCHTPSLIPFADSDVPLRAMYHMAAFVADGVPVFDIRQAAGMTDLLVGDAKLGRALASTLGSKSAALMRHHGAVVVASSIPNVVGRSVYLDINARMQIQTAALGGKATYVDPAEARLRMTDPNEYARAWDAWKRKVSR
jgi:ribulose-5-phosphate 4-epimerase/fuculose-1-phosphate aldolase